MSAAGKKIPVLVSPVGTMAGAAAVPVPVVTSVVETRVGMVNGGVSDVAGGHPEPPTQGVYEVVGTNPGNSTVNWAQSAGLSGF